jgi:nucleoside-diphosphate-sugar epimerase
VTHPYVIPEIYRQLCLSTKDRKNHTVQLGNNSQRDFLYAGDAVRIAAELLEKGKFGEVYNSGSEEMVYIYKLPQMVAEAMCLNGRVTVNPDKARMRPWEIWVLRSDNTKLYQTIEYRPQVKLQDAIQLTVDWYQENHWLPDW